MSDHSYKFNVTMTCGGCSGAVTRVLQKLEGMSPVNVLPLLSTLLCIMEIYMLTKHT
jgi:copper chaperone CopZ